MSAPSSRLAGLTDWWNRYWFSPAPYLDLSVVRLIVVGGQLLLLSVYFIYDADRIVLYTQMDEQMYFAHPILRLLTFPLGLDYRPSAADLMLVYYGTLTFGVLAFVGLMTNLSLGVFLLGNMFLISHFYSYGDYHHTEAPLILLMGLLVLSPCGRVLSLDSKLFGRRRSRPANIVDERGEMAGWAIKLMQWLFALIYLSAFLEKMVFQGGFDWLNGYTLQYYMARDTLARGSLLGEFTHRHHEFVMLSQYVSAIFQGTFWVSLLIPRLKWIYVPLGFAFHVIIYLQLKAPFPEWMIAYAIFVPWAAAWQRWQDRRGDQRSAALHSTAST